MEENNNPNAQPAPDAGMPNMPKEENGSAGPIIGTIIILAIIILGGFYFWSQRADAPVAEDIDSQIEEINTQSESDDISSIEADLNATDIDSIDSELNVESQ